MAITFQECVLHSALTRRSDNIPEVAVYTSFIQLSAEEPTTFLWHVLHWRRGEKATTFQELQNKHSLGCSVHGVVYNRDFWGKMAKVSPYSVPIYGRYILNSSDQFRA